MTYIHQLEQWPRINWDTAALADRLAEVRHDQGRLLGRIEGLGFELRSEASLQARTEDVVKSWAIEGEPIDTDEVRSSIASRLGLAVGGAPRASRQVEGIVEMMLDATTNYSMPVTKERLFGWHAALFPTGRSGLRRIAVGKWRSPSGDPMQVISGAIGREKVHFEAPDSGRVSAEMKQFLEWLNSAKSIDPVLEAGAAHLWFLTIHPFEDGNGRIGRALADLLLARADKDADRFYSLSAQIERDRKGYYDQLESAQRGSLDITIWQQWFLETLGRAISSADELIGATLRKAALWARARTGSLGARQEKVLERMFRDFRGPMTTTKYAKIADCSQDTALRDIQSLVELGVLARNPSGGRSTSYRLADPRLEMDGGSGPPSRQ